MMSAFFRRWPDLADVIHTHHAHLPYRSVAGATQTRGIEIGPGLLCAVGVDVEPVGLGERMRNAGFDLWGECWQQGEASGDNGCNRDCGKRFDHDGPLFWALLGPSFAQRLDTCAPFRNVFALHQNGFIPPKFCFVGAFQDETPVR